MPLPTDLPAEFSLETLRGVLIKTFPELADANFRLLALGWDSVAVDVDDRLIFKFPRDEDARKALVMEAGVLEIIRPAVSMAVPELVLFQHPRLFSRHSKILGEHLLTGDYEALAESDRDRLAADMALFYAQLHALPAEMMAKAGAGPIYPWAAPDDVLHRVMPLLPSALQDYAERTIAAWGSLAPDPLGNIYGFFDGHGWNMAFDHSRGRLNGIYDFADSGFGMLHHEFIYSNFISAELTERIIGKYEALTGKSIERQRVDLLTGALRLAELAAEADNPDNREWMLRVLAEWAG